MDEQSVRFGTDDQYLLLVYGAPIRSGWLGQFKVLVQQGTFRAEADCWDNPASTGGIYSLRSQIEAMSRNLTGKVEFSPLERQLEFRMTIDRKGGIEVTGVLHEYATHGASLHFEIALDQTYLPEIISSLKALGV
ncbi:MAG: hypothetical protein AAGA89_14065 [Pseudomonadota bacterium]